jgi:MYXO-CTERM domain-containing protein
MRGVGRIRGGGKLGFFVAFLPSNRAWRLHRIGVMNRSLVFVLGVISSVTLAVPAGAVVNGVRNVEIRGLEARPVQKIGGAKLLYAHRPTDAKIDEAVRAEIAADPGFFQVAPAALTLVSVRSFSDDMTYVDYKQTFGGLEVVGGTIDVTLKSGKLVLSTANVFPDVSVPSLHPAIGAAAGDTLAWRALADAGFSVDSIEKSAQLVIFPEGAGAYRLAYRDVIRTSNPAGRWQSIVSADGTNRVLFRHDLIAYESAQVKIEIEPRYIGQTPVAVAAKDVNVGTGHADEDGIFESTAGSATINTISPYFQIANQAATKKTLPITIAGTPGESFTWSMASAEPQEVDAFVYAHQAREHEYQVAPDLQYFQQRMTVNVNVSGTCNAYYDGSSLNFFPTGGGCNSTARIADVTYHEYGHSIHDNLTGGGGFNSQIQEGVADIFAHTITNDPNLGPYFFPGNPVGIRNATDVRTYPTGVQGNNSEVHESGKIWTNTFWNIRTAFITKYGYNLGTRLFDLMHSRTLRSNPGYTSVYMAALAADDDDGNLSNGTPDSCEMNPEFQSHGLIMSGAQATRGYLQLTGGTEAVTQAKDTEVPVAVHVASLSPSCGGLDATSVTLHYSVDGAAEQTIALSGAGPDFSGSIPAQKDGSTVTYWFSAKEDAQGASFSGPLGAPMNVYRYHVGTLDDVFTDDFETDKGWTHGADIASHDDWERGTPTGAAIALDPAAAFSGASVIGNDIGLRGGNGLYEAGASSWLESPAIDCSGCTGTRLQFRRWLSVEGNTNDHARVLVNGTEVWSNEAAPRSDLQWEFEDIDISALADHQAAVKVRFELTSDNGMQFGGWTLDDVGVRKAHVGGGGGGGGGIPGTGDSLNGGCACSTVGATAPAAGSLASLALALAAAGLVIRRRRD